MCKNIMNKICETCRYYKPDFGTWCFNGWSRDGTDGKCMLEPKPIYRKSADIACKYYEKK